MEEKPITMVDVRDIAPIARRVVAAFERDFAAELAEADVQHIGATALPFGHTKGDVDVNVRVSEARFPLVVAALGRRLAEAQRENWTESFASFSAAGYDLPLGVQLTAIGSSDDFLIALRDRMHGDPSLLRRYDDVKVAAASAGAEAYWQAKNGLLRDLLGDRLSDA
jgi:GrpB-like predicted nucleotidyltransferase (UPF0157 family)